MTKLNFILDDHIERLMDDIPPDMWYNRAGEQIQLTDTNDDEDCPQFVKLECLSSW